MPKAKKFAHRTFLKSAAAGGLAAFPAPHVFAQSGGVPFIHAAERGYFAQEGIRIVAMDPASGADAMQRAASETCDFGFADLPALVEWHLRDPDATPLGIFNACRSTPAAIVSWKSANIQ
jgi:NitT/TauT family transport system substrate-binding protein